MACRRRLAASQGGDHKKGKTENRPLKELRGAVESTTPTGMDANLKIDDDIVVPVTFDSETLSRLVRFANAIGKHPLDAAADLLRDILLEDEQAHAALN